MNFVEFNKFKKNIDNLNIDEKEQVKELVIKINVDDTNFNNWVENIFSENINQLDMNKLPYVIDELYQSNDIENINENLHIVSGNALDYDDFKKCEKYFNPNNELAIINEGLLRYLTFEEKKDVATNIYNMLKKYNGVWITCDVTPKAIIQKQNETIPNYNFDVSTITSRNDLNDRFDDIEHIKSFFGDIGFKNIEIHKFIEMKDELKSFDILGIDKNQYDELLKNAIVAILKI